MTLLETGGTERLSRERLLRPVAPENLESTPAPDHRPRDRRSLRALLAADVVAATAGAAAGPATVAVLVPVVLVLSALFGLYRRDEMVIRKTTLDEAPQLFMLATLAALAAWWLGTDLTRLELLALIALLGGSLV